MKKGGVLFFLLLLLALTSPAFAAPRAVADLSEDFVAVREGFAGAQLTVFGVLRGGADVAIVVEGPPAEAWVRPKLRQMGLWINGEAEIIAPVPAYYAILTSEPVDKMVDAATAQRYGLSLDGLAFGASDAGRGFIENRKKAGLYRENAEGVRILENKLFRAAISLPASVPLGAYKAHVYEFINGALAASRTEELRVEQVGTGAQIKATARQRPLLYGALSLFLSLGVGAGASMVFRKRG